MLNVSFQSPILHPLFMFAPTVEEYFKDSKDTFISDLPINILRRGDAHKIPWMAGVNSEEGLLYSGSRFNYLINI